MMNQELLTMARYNMHILNIVFTNETLGYIQAEQEDESNQPLSGVIIPDNDWSKVAEGMNVKGVTVRTKKEYGRSNVDRRQVHSRNALLD